MSNYTQYIEDHYWGNMAAVCQSTKKRLLSIRTGDAESELPIIIEQFRSDHTCSARRYLMNYFQNRSVMIESLDQFSFVYQDKSYLFSRVTNDRARALDAEERDAYIQLICAIAAANSKTAEKEWRSLARKAMLWNKQPEMLTREEAFRLGHGLRFSLQEMDAFLLRVLDNDGMSYARSEDVIEAFCFIYEPANDFQTAKKLKDDYAAATKNIAKLDPEQKSSDFTVKMESSLQSRVHKWQAQTSDVQHAFLQWLIGQAPYLDIPSRSAKQVYCRLTQLAYNWTLDPMQIPEESAFSDKVLDFCLQKDGSAVGENMAYRMTERILSNASVEFDNLRKRQTDQIWRYLTVDQKGCTTAVATGKRIPFLLLGKEPISKADVLFMLWYVGDLCWTENSISGEVVCDRTADFWSVSEKLLEAGNLPEFYAPHMLERCFLRAICTKNETGEYPFEVYEGMCEYVLPEKQQRKRSKQGSRMEKSRAQLEKEATQAFVEEGICFAGIERRLADHFLKHGQEKGKYLFTKAGISYLPDPRVVISYSDAAVAELFDLERTDYMQEDVAQERFRFVFGLGLYLQQEADTFGVHCEFRTNYQRNATLTILHWEQIQKEGQKYERTKQ